MNYHRLPPTKPTIIVIILDPYKDICIGS